MVERTSNSLQKAKEPEIMPFATAVGNIVCASFVKGACNAANSVGGMTSLNLPNHTMSNSAYPKKFEYTDP
jgi:hypothetical protein